MLLDAITLKSEEACNKAREELVAKAEAEGIKCVKIKSFLMANMCMYHELTGIKPGGY